MKIILIVIISILTVSAQVKELLEKQKQMDTKTLNLAKIRSIQNVSNSQAQNQSQNNSYIVQPAFNAILSSNSTTPASNQTQNVNTTTSDNSEYNQNIIRVLDLTKANFYKIEPKTQVQKYYNATSGFYEVRLTYNTTSQSPNPFPNGTYFMINDTLIVVDLGYNPNSQDKEAQLKYDKSQTEISKQTIEIPIFTSKFAKVEQTKNEGYLKQINVNGTSELFGIKNDKEQEERYFYNGGSIFKDPFTASEELYDTSKNMNTKGIIKNENGKYQITGTSNSDSTNYNIEAEHQDLINAEIQQVEYDDYDQFHITHFDQYGDKINSTHLQYTENQFNETRNANALSDRVNYNKDSYDESNSKTFNRYQQTISQSSVKGNISLLEFTYSFLDQKNYQFNKNKTVSNIHSTGDELHQFRYRNISRTQSDQKDYIQLANSTDNYSLENNTISERNDVNGYSRTKYNETYTYDSYNYLTPQNQTQYNTSKVGSYMKVPNRGVGRLFHLNE